jgi:hypothetical protein
VSTPSVISIPSVREHMSKGRISSFAEEGPPCMAALESLLTVKLFFRQLLHVQVEHGLHKKKDINEGSIRLDVGVQRPMSCSSNLARVKFLEKSLPSSKLSISIPEL